MNSQTIEDYRQGLKDGELLVQKCNACGGLNMYPRYACPHCQSDDLGWQKVSGKGQLMSYTILRAGAPEGFEDDLPYALGVVKLEEGPQLLGRLHAGGSGDWSGYACDMAVQFEPVSAEQIEQHPAAWFKQA